ncbi:MAG: cytochrome C [Bacteroidetes bacterium]|nr:MAG: cytochrome C [Bacteroidota bacterium]
MKHPLFYTLIVLAGFLLFQCGTNNQSNVSTASNDSNIAKHKTDTVVMMAGINSKGIGRFDTVKLTHPLDQKMAANGQDIYQAKCFACHKLTSELLVGPGWYGVTKRRTPEWIMNWVTNTKVMIDKDLAAQADMAVCLIRMPNQDLTDEQARQILEFMRKNDGEK